MQNVLFKDDNTEQRFRELYYHLYSNSNSSRSERIIADLSKLILVSISYSRGDMRSEVSLFINGNGTANTLLMPALASLFPDVINDGETFSLDDNGLRHSLKCLQEIDLVSSPSHTFGDAFQALMGPRLRGEKGQFFTPRSVVRAMVQILAPKNQMRVIDPACGTGGFLSAVLDLWKRDDTRGTVVGVDKDGDMSLLASALSSVHSGTGEVIIHNANSLSISVLEQKGVLMGTFDRVFTNPPFGAKIGVTDPALLKDYDLGHMWDRYGKVGSWFKNDLVRSTQDPQVLFIELCVRLLKQDGKMAIVLPEGIFGNNGAGYIWDYLRHNGTIDALIDCPRTTFQPGTDTKTNILIFTKTRERITDKKCWVAVAYTCGHDKRGKSLKADGKSVSDDFSRIADDWNRPDKERLIWNQASITDPYYMVPRYYDQKLSDDVAQDAARLNADVVTLGELSEAGLISLRKGHEVGSDCYGSGEIPFVRTSDIHNFEVSHDPTNCVSEEIYAKYRDQQKLKDGDILMVVDGRYKIGRCAILNETNTKCVVQSHIRILSLTHKAKFPSIAMLYGLSLPSVQKEIRRLVFIQSTLGGLGSRILEIRLPDPRGYASWGSGVERFREAIVARAQHASYLQSYGHEVEL